MYSRFSEDRRQCCVPFDSHSLGDSRRVPASTDILASPRGDFVLRQHTGNLGQAVPETGKAKLVKSTAPPGAAINL